MFDSLSSDVLRLHLSTQEGGGTYIIVTKSKFKFSAGKNHLTKYFSHNGSGGGLVGGTKTKAGEIVCVGT